MAVLWIRNEKPPVKLQENEFIGEPRQSTFIDPLGKSGYMHVGETVEELKEKGFVGIYRSYGNVKTNS